MNAILKLILLLLAVLIIILGLYRFVLNNASEEKYCNVFGYDYFHKVNDTLICFHNDNSSNYIVVTSAEYLSMTGRNLSESG